MVTVVFCSRPLEANLKPVLCALGLGEVLGRFVRLPAGHEGTGRKLPTLDERLQVEQSGPRELTQGQRLQGRPSASGARNGYQKRRQPTLLAAWTPRRRRGSSKTTGISWTNAPGYWKRQPTRRLGLEFRSYA